MWLDEPTVTANLFVLDSSFKIVAGLSGKGISLQSIHYPNRYIRHKLSFCFIDINDGTDLFKKDASFMQRAGFFGKGTVSFESVNYPGHFIRHILWRAKVDKKGGLLGDLLKTYEKDASWLPKLGK